MVLNPILKFFRDLETFNEDRDFIRYRESNIRSAFTLITALGITALMFFHFVDLVLDKPLAGQLLKIRALTSIALLVNLLMLLGTRYNHRRKIFACTGFYIGIVASALITHFADQSEARYWSAPALMLIVWFAFIPLRFPRQVLHGVFYLLLYSGLIWFMGKGEIDLLQFAGTNLLLVGFLLIGIILAFAGNQASSAVYSARKAARTSDDRYRILTEYMQDVVWTLDMHTLTFSFVSPSVERLRGFTAEEVKRMPFEASFTPQSAGKVKEMLEDVARDFKEGKDINSFAVGELEQYCRDGSTVWIEVAATLITDERGELTEMLGVSRNITARRNSEELLRESEERYRSIFNTAADAIFLIDKLSGDIVDVNQPASRIYGYSTDELLTMQIQHLADEPDDTIDVLDSFNRFHLVPQRKSLRKNGEVVLVEISASYFEMEGKPYVIAMVHDITQRIKAEEALRESEIKFREITDLLPQLIYELDIHGNITFMNRTGKEMFGLTEADIRKGLPAASLVVPEQRERLMRNFTEVISLHFGEIENEFRGLRSDGSEFPILIYGSAVLRDGSVTGNRGIVVDISDRKIAEEELRRVNERLTLHFRETPLAYIEWNEKLEVTDWNPSAESIFGYTREEVLGKHAFELIVPKHIQAEIELLSDSILNQSGGQRNTNRNITKDGQEIICNWYNTPLKDTFGKVTGLASLVQDITEQKKLEAELEKYVTVLEKNYSESKIKVQTYSVELETRKSELLRLQKENLQSQFETLRSQVNPHFLFNSLNVLTSLIRIEPDLAEQFTIQLSMVYRYVLENKEKDLVNLETELDFLKAYTFLLNIRFSGKMKILVNLPDKKLQLKVVPLALQLLIENAIKHNTFSKNQPLQVDVFSEDDYLVVQNNLQLRGSHVQSTGVGLENIASRYAYFTDRKTFSGVDGDKFVVKIPLL